MSNKYKILVAFALVILSTGFLLLKNSTKAYAYNFNCPPAGGQNGLDYLQWIGGYTADGGANYYLQVPATITTADTSVSAQFSGEAIHCGGSPWSYADNFRMVPVSETVDGSGRVWASFNQNVIFSFGTLQRGQKSSSHSLNLKANTTGISAGTHNFCLTWHGAVNPPGGGSTLFSNSTSTFCIVVKVNQAPPALGATCSLTLNKSTYNSGDQIIARFTVKNTGSSTWNVVYPDSNNHIFKLGAVDGTPTYKDSSGNTVTRIRVPAQGGGGLGPLVVQPGYTVFPQQTFVAPSSSGTYTMKWQMLQEGAVWFGDTCTATFNVNAPTPPPPTCSAVIINPSQPEANQPFQVTIGANASSTSKYLVTGISIAGNSQENSGYTGSFSKTYTNSGKPPGTYRVSWTLTPFGGKALPPCGRDINVGNQPYLKVYGNDVAVGDGFMDSKGQCTLDNDRATILTLDNYTSHTNNFAGSSSQLAAFAMGEIASFFSGGQQSGTGAAASPANGLSFGNYGLTGARPVTAQNGKVNGYGGKTDQQRCISDSNYYTPIKNKIDYTIPSSSSSASLNDILGHNNSYYHGSKLVINNPGSAQVTGQHAIVVDGDVEISGDITYGSFTGGVGGIPSLYIVAKGNIYIDNNVTKLAGVYVAQPTGVTDNVHTKGTIVTCANNGAAVQSTDLYAQCSKQLIIDGAFIAQRIQFLRSFGTVSDSTTNEDYGTTKAAEVFEASPSLYLSGPSALQTGSDTYDSITSLPPIL